MNLIKTRLAVLITATLGINTPVFADNLSSLKAEIAQMRSDYEQRIQQLEQRLAKTEASSGEVKKDIAYVKETTSNIPASKNKNNFNPAISMVLNGTFSQYQNDPADYALDGFSLQGEAGLHEEGFSLGESELTISANIDQSLYGQATVAVHEHEGQTELEIEEAFIESLSLANGVTARAGRFFAPVGYLNQRHVHTWNFADAPLIYRGLFGNQLSTDGLKLSYILPTDQLIELGGTLGAGNSYPGGGEESGIGDWLIFAKTGGDINIESSWEASISHWQSSPKDRAYTSGHTHDGGEESSPLFNGDTDITNVSLIYKWAPNGNFRQKNFSLIGEYFYQSNDGSVSHEDEGEFSTYDGKQSGAYIEGIYQFSPQWRSGLRYDWLSSDHKGSDVELLGEVGLLGSKEHPQRSSAMVEYLPSEFSRIRAQVNFDQSSADDDLQLLLQYTVSLGAHGAHSY